MRKNITIDMLLELKPEEIIKACQISNYSINIDLFIGTIIQNILYKNELKKICKFFSIQNLIEVLEDIKILGAIEPPRFWEEEKIWRMQTKNPIGLPIEPPSFESKELCNLLWTTFQFYISKYA